jgi:hypothetical protein
VGKSKKCSLCGKNKPERGYRRCVDCRSRRRAAKGRAYARDPEAAKASYRAEYRRRRKRVGAAVVREEARQAMWRWRWRNPELARAVAAVRRAIRRGELVRPEACQECKADCYPCAVILNPAIPLDHLRWLCRSCAKAERRVERTLQELVS